MESVPFALQSMSTHGFALAQSDGLAIFINSAALSASCAIALLAAAFGTAGYMRLMAKGYSSTIATLSGFVSVISGFAFPVVVWTLVLGDHPSPSGDVSECLTLLNGALCGLLFALIYWGRARQLPGNPSRTGHAAAASLLPPVGHSGSSRPSRARARRRTDVLAAGWLERSAGLHQSAATLHRCWKPCSRASVVLRTALPCSILQGRPNYSRRVRAVPAAIRPGLPYDLQVDRI